MLKILIKKMDLISTLNSLTPSFYQLASSEGNGSADVEAIHDFPPSEEPVYILGRKYSSLHELDEIRADVQSLVWVTYRRGFPSIGDSGMTADSGWGCMLRTGQMVLAQALCRLHLGRDWRWQYTDSSTVQKLVEEHQNTRDQEAKESENKTTSDYEKYLKYRQILKLFADQKNAPYSIHQIALMGSCEGKEVGEWFGPNTVAQVLKKLSVYDKVNDIHVHVAMDNMVFIDDIKRFCKSKLKLESMRLATSTKAVEATELNKVANFWRPLLLFIPLRLGLTDINPLYFRSLKSTFALPQSLGILGGRPNHALYLIGCVGDDLVYLDPHTTQTAVNIADGEAIRRSSEESSTTEKASSSHEHHSSEAEAIAEVCDDVSYHCERASRLPIASLDPSLALCFLCTSEEDFDQWATLVMKKLVGGGSHHHHGSSSPEKELQTQPLFEIMKQRPANWPGFEEEEDFDYLSASASSKKSASSTHNHPLQSANATGQCSTSAAAAVLDGSVPSPASSFTALESDEDYEIIEY